MVIQQTFTCLKSTIDILEKGEKYVQSFNNNDTRTMTMMF